MYDFSYQFYIKNIFFKYYKLALLVNIGVRLKIYKFEDRSRIKVSNRSFSRKKISMVEGGSYSKQSLKIMKKIKNVMIPTTTNIPIR